MSTTLTQQQLTTIPATLKHVSYDAIADEKLGLIYAARVALSRTVMDVEGREVKLTPGMAATVEIKTGMRRVLEYVLGPLMRASSEAGRER